MWLALALLGAIVLLGVIYPKIKERREAEAAERMERFRDPHVASAEVDRLIEMNRQETDFFLRLRGRR